MDLIFELLRFIVTEANVFQKKLPPFVTFYSFLLPNYSTPFFISHFAPLYLDAIGMNALRSDWIRKTPTFSLTFVLQKPIFCCS